MPLAPALDSRQPLTGGRAPTEGIRCRVSDVSILWLTISTSPPDIHLVQLPAIALPGPHRHRDQREHRLTISVPTRTDPTLVVCPECGKKAFVLPASGGPETSVKVVCHACGYMDRSSGQLRCFAWYAENPSDGYFGLDLWLQTRCAGHSLWAFNRRHLDFLESYVSASLRERRQNEWGWRNASLASRLPRWMTSASNRQTVLAGIRALRQRM